MSLSKVILRQKTTFLTAIKSHKLHSSHFHILQSPIAQYRQVNAALEPLVWNVISRLESSQASIAKDTILHLPNIPKGAVAAKTNDGLPDIPVPQTASPPIDAVTTPVSELPEIIAEAVAPLNQLGEPTLQSIGLGSYYTPAGWMQHWLEFLHVTFEMPWWGAIGLTVVIIRALMFPLVIQSQKNAAKMHNIMPDLMKLQEEMKEARASGNQIETLKTGHKLGKFMQENKISPFASFKLPLVQAPIFLSMFLGLRKMANVPVESMTTGGLYWFTDLTIPDQYYILPLITCSTLFLTLHYGVEMGKLETMGRFVSVGMKVIPVVLFPFIMNFPSGVCVYWMTTNFVSLAQVFFLKVPAVRKYFGIDKQLKHDPSKVKNKKGFITEVKSSFSNMRLSKEIADRERMDQVSFERAGRLPPAKTFKYNPTLVNPNVVESKKKFSAK